MYMVRRHLFNLNVVNIVYFAVMHTIIIHLQNVSLFLSHLYNVDSLQGLNRSSTQQVCLIWKQELVVCCKAS